MKHIRIGHVDWQSFLCSTPANDYIFQKTPYEEQIKMAADAIKEADCIIIGAGAGLSPPPGSPTPGNDSEHISPILPANTALRICIPAGSTPTPPWRNTGPTGAGTST